MGFTDWVRRRRVHRLVILVPFWTVACLIGDSVAHLLLGWEMRLTSALIYGGLMAVGFTFWPCGILGWNGQK
jgi:hypothetical protein